MSFSSFDGYEGEYVAQRRSTTQRSTIQPWVKGDHCGALWDDGSVYHSIVQETYDDGTCLVLYVDYNETAEIPSSSLTEWTSAIPETNIELNDLVVQAEGIQNMQSRDFVYVQGTAGTSDEVDEIETESSVLCSRMDGHPLFGAEESGEGCSEDERRLWKRYRLVREIVTSEQSYVEGCEVLVDVYITPLAMSCVGKDRILENGKSDIKKIFSDFDLIAVLNRKFLTDLENRVFSWTSDSATQLIGDLFIQFAPYFKMYSQYVNNHEKSSRLLGTMMKDGKYKKFHQFLEQANAHPSAQFYTLQGLLISPIQRVPRYKLLLNELKRYTPTDHPDLDNIGKALDLVSKVAKHINEAVGARQNRETILVIQNQFASDPKFISPSRRFIRQGPLTKICRNNSHKKYEFFLFNDMIAYASYSSVSKKYKLHRKIPIDSAFQVDEIDDLDESSNKNVAKFRMHFINSQKSFVAYASDENSKMSWLEDIDECIEEQSKTVQLQSNNQVKAAPVQQVLDDVNICPHCRLQFSLFNRKYTCKFCGKVTCKDCSKSRLVLEGKLTSSGDPDSTPQRVCDECATHIRQVLDPEQQTEVGDAELEEADSKRQSLGSKPELPPRPDKLPILLLLHKKNIIDWDTNDVSQWIKSGEFASFAAAFEQKNVTGKVLVDLTLPILASDYRMSDLSLRKRFLDAIVSIRNQQKIAPTLPPRTHVLPVNRGNYSRQNLRKSILFVPKQIVNKPNAAMAYFQKKMATTSSSSSVDSLHKDEHKTATDRPAVPPRPTRRAPKRPQTVSTNHFIEISPVKHIDDRLNSADDIIYHLRLRTATGIIRTITKLYSHFQDFDQQLTLFHPDIETRFQLPSEFPVGGKVSRDDIIHRQEGLNTYIQGISTVPDYCDGLAEFLGIKLSKWKPNDAFYKAHNDWNARKPETGSSGFKSFLSRIRGPSRAAPRRPSRLYQKPNDPNKRPAAPVVARNYSKPSRSNTAEDLGIDSGIVARLVRTAKQRDQQAQQGGSVLSDHKKTTSVSDLPASRSSSIGKSTKSPMRPAPPKPTTKFCQHCGTVREKQNAFCSNCGSKF